LIDDSAVISHLQEGLPDYKSSEEGDEEGDGRDPPVVFSPIQECMYAEELPPSRLQRIQEVLDHDTFRVEPSQVSNGQVGRSGPLPVLLPPTNSGFFLFHLLLFVLLSQICLSGLHMLLYLTVLPSLFFLLLLILQPATHFLIKTLTFSSTFNSCPLSLRICRVFAPEISNQRIIMYVHDACFAASIAHASMSAVSHAN